MYRLAGYGADYEQVKILASVAGKGIALWI